MCGIAGFSLSPTRYSREQRDILSTMLALGIAARGTDSWGVAVGHGEATVGLGSIANLKALESIGDAPSAILHARFRTTGPITLAASHPFVVGNHTFAHNGAIWNHQQIGQYLVDSIVLGDALAGKVPWSALDGYGALCWYRAERPDPRCAKISKEGELWLWEGRKGTAFASTKRILETALHYADISGGSVYEARLGMVYRLTPEGLQRYKKPATRFRISGGKSKWAWCGIDDETPTYVPKSSKASSAAFKRTWRQWSKGTSAIQQEADERAASLSLGTSRLPAIGNAPSLVTPAIPEAIGIDDTTGQVFSGKPPKR